MHGAHRGIELGRLTEKPKGALLLSSGRLGVATYGVARTEALEGH